MELKGLNKMTQKGTKTNPETLLLTNELRKASQKNKAEIWKTVTYKLNQPRRKKSGVNVGQLNQLNQDGKTILITRKLLSSGNAPKKITIAAKKASLAAVKKIEAAGGKVISIMDLIKQNPRGTNVQLVE